jgi:hypothetical protein
MSHTKRNIGFEGRRFLDLTEWLTYCRRKPVRYIRTARKPVCDVCGEPGSTENSLQNAHIIGFDVGVIDLGLTPAFLDSDENIKTAHRSTCNKQTELDLQGSMDRLRELGEKELPQYLPAWIPEAWGRQAEPRG